jgi:hypothetical protein
MKRHIPGLAQASPQERELPDGIYLVRVEGAQYRWEKQKPFYLVRFSVTGPEVLAGATVSGRLYCTVRALWKLNWFLNDFGYDPDLLGRDELDEKALIGLQGVLKLSHSCMSGHSFLNLDAFAPSDRWEEMSQTQTKPTSVAEVA